MRFTASRERSVTVDKEHLAKSIGKEHWQRRAFGKALQSWKGGSPEIKQKRSALTEERVRRRAGGGDDRRRR